MPEHTDHGDHIVTITVNEHPVRIEGPRLTGLQIKLAAITQGVGIQPNFVLSEELGNHHTRIVADADVVGVNNNSKFIAVAPDDNS